MKQLGAACALIFALNTILPVAADDDGANIAINDTTPTTQEGEYTVHWINVSEKANYFIPNNVNAKPGDKIFFRFWPGGHSVIRAAFGYPCVPYEDIEGNSDEGFYSGVMNPSSEDVEQDNVRNLEIYRSDSGLRSFSFQRGILPSTTLPRSSFTVAPLVAARRRACLELSMPMQNILCRCRSASLG